MNEEASNAEWLEMNGFALVRQSEDSAWEIIRSIWRAVGLDVGAIPSSSAERARWSQSWGPLTDLRNAMPCVSLDSEYPHGQELIRRLVGDASGFWLWDIGYTSPVIYRASCADKGALLDKLREYQVDVAVCSSSFDAVLLMLHWGEQHLWMAGICEAAKEE